MICLGVDATKRNSMDSKMTFFSPDTDVLVLIIANYHLLPEKTSISMTSGTLEIKPIWNALGPDRAKALPAFHAFTGADSTGRFARIAKTSWFKLFMEADDGIVGALSMLGCDNDVTENSLQLTLSSFVCAAYSPKGTNILSIPDLRWHLFCKYMTESERLPPTMGALKQNTLRTHVQARVWAQAAIPQQDLLDPVRNGYHKEHDGQLTPTTTDVPPAPDAITEMVRCKCNRDCSSQRCSCKSKNLPCTDLCPCSTDCENDEDTHLENRDFDSDSDDSED